VFVIVYLIVGIGIFFYGAVQIGELIVRAELQDWFGRRKMSTALKNMQDHFVVCGLGRTGMAVCQHLADKHRPFVVIERDESALADCVDRGWVCIVGDATEDRHLMAAGLDRAKGLAAVLTNDADNLYVVLSARLIRPSLQIISRATDDASAAKLQKAGADRVISLYDTGALKMAQLLLNPNLEDFFEIFNAQGGQLDLAEIHVAADGPYSGKTLDDTDFSKNGVVIVGIRRKDGELVLPPQGSTPIHVDDWLIAIGKSDAIAQVIPS
jgi:voltage-gated potassium channel